MKEMVFKFNIIINNNYRKESVKKRKKNVLDKRLKTIKLMNKNDLKNL